MPINFHSETISGTYASRTANNDWTEAMHSIVDPDGKIVADIGCGGGIYSRAWSDLGAAHVTGVDFSARMVADAADASSAYPSVSFTQGDATATGLPDLSADIVFERALIHHLNDLGSAFTEAHRILKPGGTLIVQDRTMDDVLRPASPEHFRGYFFQAFPRLLTVEHGRRPHTRLITDAMTGAGFKGVSTMSLPEVRRIYASSRELEDDLRARTGRSILHELTDDELDTLIQFISGGVGNAFPLREVDFWTVWSGTKPV